MWYAAETKFAPLSRKWKTFGKLKDLCKSLWTFFFYSDDLETSFLDSWKEILIFFNGFENFIYF